MRQDWKYLPLGEICDLLNGFAFKSNLYVKEGIRVIRIANVQKGYIEDNAPAFYPSDHEKVLSRYMLQEGDLLMSLTGNVGRVGILHKEMLPAALNQRVACIRLRKNDVLLKYLFHYFNSDYFEKMCIASSHGVAQLNMSTVWLAKHLVPVPPLAEQERIVALLDDQFAKIDQLKANAELQLRAAKDLFQSALKEMLTPQEGWEEKKLCELCSISGEYGLNEASTTYNGIRYLRITDITDNGDLNDDKVSAIHNSDRKQSKLIEGDILFARTGATVGKTLVYREDFGDCEFAGYLIRYRTNPNVILPRYLFYLTHSNNYYKWVAENQAAAAQPNISAQKYNNLIISFPPLAEQERIAARLDEISEKVKALQANYDQTITLCNDLKQSLLKSIFA